MSPVPYHPKNHRRGITYLELFPRLPNSSKYSQHRWGFAERLRDLLVRGCS